MNRPILLPGPTDPRFWIALWMTLFAGLLGVAGFVVWRTGREVAAMLDEDPFGEPWGDC